MTDQTQNPALPEGTEAITNMDQLAFLVANWFDNGQAQAHQLLQVPDGQPITVTLEKDAEPEQLVLTGDTLKGFKAGIIVMANIFGQLPFGRTVAPTPVEPAASNDVKPASGD
jgi:hypothetical protein